MQGRWNTGLFFFYGGDSAWLFWIRYDLMLILSLLLSLLHLSLYYVIIIIVVVLPSSFLSRFSSFSSSPFSLLPIFFSPTFAFLSLSSSFLYFFFSFSPLPIHLLLSLVFLSLLLTFLLSLPFLISPLEFCLFQISGNIVAGKAVKEERESRQCVK